MRRGRRRRIGGSKRRERERRGLELGKKREEEKEREEMAWRRFIFLYLSSSGPYTKAEVQQSGRHGG